MLKINKKELINYSIVIFVFLIIYLLENIFNIDIFFCPINKLTGLYCPGCGITRMIESLIKLDFYQAFRYNMLVFIMLPFLTFLLICRIIEIYKGKLIITNKISNKVWIIILIITILFGILRNIPGFEVLIPTKI